MSSAVVAMPRAYVQPGPRGQLQVALPGVSRARYVTGQQESCVPCAAAGVRRQGVSRDGAGSEPLCMSCWRGREQRRARAEQAELDRRLWEQIGELDTVAALEQACGACGELEGSPSCWLCGYAWLRQAEREFEEQQAAEAAAVEEKFTLIAAVSEAEARVADLTGWIERLRETVRTYEAGFGGRAVELLADLLARLEAEAAGRANRRGRPSVTRYVGAVLAVDADWRSGRRSLPGRERTAWFLDCSDRAVYDAWKQVTALGWAKRVRIGGRNSKERREETGRWNDRAEFDLVQLHRSPVPTAARAAFVPVAMGLIGELLERALTVLEREHAALDEARARAGGWTDYPEQVRRTQLRAAVARTREQVTDPLPALALTANICRSHPVSKGEYLSSCSLWGLRFSPQIMIHKCRAEVGLAAGEEGGASRPAPTRSGRDDLDSSCFRSSQRVSHHRMLYRTKRVSRRAAPPPAWSQWAYELVKDLIRLWPWVARMPRPWAAAILGSKLGPDWTADRLARWVTEQRGRPILPDPAAPAAYLRTVIDEAFTSGVQPPLAARRHAEHRRQVAMTVGAEQADAHGALSAQLDERDTAAAAATGAGLAEFRAARARLGHRRPTTAARPAAAWPSPAVPGGGLPSGWNPSRDR